MGVDRTPGVVLAQGGEELCPRLCPLVPVHRGPPGTGLGLLPVPRPLSPATGTSVWIFLKERLLLPCHPRRPHCTLQGGRVAGAQQTRERRPVPRGLTKRAGKMPFSDGAVSCQGDLRRGLT